MNCPICGQPMVLMTTVFAEGGAEDVWACFNEHCQEGLDAEMREVPLDSQGTLPGYGDLSDDSIGVG